jgi:transcriptional regulator with XRE-family HTH domain
MSPEQTRMSYRKDTAMWLDKLKELKTAKGLTSKQIADATKLPERTIVRLFSGDTDNPYVDTLHRIVTALGGSLDDILTDTKVVVATETLAEVKETLAEVKESADAAEADRDHIADENVRLRVQVAELSAKIDRLEMQLQHKDELIELLRQHKDELRALHNYYNKRGTNYIHKTEVYDHEGRLQKTEHKKEH